MSAAKALISASLILCEGIALAQDTAPSPLAQNQNTEKKPAFSQNKIYDLGKIEITDAKSVDHNASIATITSQDIDNTSSKSVDEALRFSPGVFIQPPSGARRARNPNPRV